MIHRLTNNKHYFVKKEIERPDTAQCFFVQSNVYCVLYDKIDKIKQIYKNQNPK